MVSTYTTNLGLENPTPADPATNNTWGTTENTGRSLTDSAIAGIQSLSVAGAVNVVLTSNLGAADQSRNAHFVFTGVLTGNIYVLWPNGKTRVFSVYNNTTGSFTLGLGVNNGASVPAGTTFTISQGQIGEFVSDGTNVTQRTSVPLNLSVPVPVLLGGTGSTVGPILRGYLSGLTLSNDGGSPNTILDISAGVATDSTGAALISLAAFTKSTGGVWVAGTGNFGMGTGLVVQASTWYHAFGIINAGAADAYLDTSVTAANKPAGTTAFRRIGSIKTNAASQIVAFLQDGDYFQWSPLSSTLEVNSTNPGTGAQTATLNVPTGVNVIAQTIWALQSTSTLGNSNLLISDLGVTAVAPNANRAQISNVENAAGSTELVNGEILTRTNTSGQVRWQLSYSDANVGVGATTRGWYDSRGRTS